MLFFQRCEGHLLIATPPPSWSIICSTGGAERGDFQFWFFFFGGGGMLGNWPVFNGRCVYSNYMLTCPPPLILAVPALALCSTSHRRAYVQKKCSYTALQRHCTENSKQILPEMKLSGLFTNSYIHVSVSDLYIPTIGPQTQYSKIGRPIMGIYKSLTDTWVWKFGTRPRSFISGNT